jgi:hypothetical protein
VIGWIADWFRTAWALISWNLRKSIFRLRQAQGFSPCQNPSDSGRAWETRCDACFGWSKPARFHRVCPLLRTAPDGTLKCSVDTREVRPFWLRAAAFYVGAALAVYLLGVAAVFGTMRLIGYPVSVQTIAWPPAWKEINRARSTYFFRRAEAAYSQQQINEAVMSLSLAYNYDASNYDAGLMLARIWQTGRPEAANHLFGQLLKKHPDRRATTAQHWLRALVPRADYHAIEELAAAALHFDAEHAAVWLNALFFSIERTGNRELLARLQQHADTLPAGVQQVLRLELALTTENAVEAITGLAQPRDRTLPNYVAYYQIKRLIELGFAQIALDLATIETRRLSDQDRVSLELHALATLNLRHLRVVALDNVLGHTNRLPIVQLIATHLIHHPDRALYDRWLSRFDLARISSPEERHAAALAVFCVAGVHGDEARLAHFAQQLRESTGTPYAALSSAEAFFRTPNTGRIQDILPLLQPLSLEINYALLARFGRDGASSRP